MRTSRVGQVEGTEYVNTRKGKLRPSWSTWSYIRKEIFFLMRPERKRQSWVRMQVVWKVEQESPLSIYFLSLVGGQVNQFPVVKGEVLE